MKKLQRSESVWLVDPDTRVANEFTSETLTTQPVFTPYDMTFLARWFESKGLTVANIQAIFQQAAVHVTYEKETSEILDGYAPMDEEYLRLRIPSTAQFQSLTLGGCVGLTFECISRDQGGSQGNEPHQSPKRCHRWLEFEVLDDQNKRIVPRQDVCRMFRSSKEYRRHVLHIQDRQDILKSMSIAGHQIALHVRADKEGSSNYAKYARIALHYAAKWSPQDGARFRPSASKPSSSPNKAQTKATEAAKLAQAQAVGEQEHVVQVVKDPPVQPAVQPANPQLPMLAKPLGDTKIPAALVPRAMELQTPNEKTRAKALSIESSSSPVASVDVSAIVVGLKDTSWEKVDAVEKPKPLADEWVDVMEQRSSTPATDKPEDRDTCVIC